jgi:hypothetical protein
VNTHHWSYILVYLDDVLVIHHNPKEIMDFMSQWYTLKEGIIKELELNLGNDDRL